MSRNKKTKKISQKSSQKKATAVAIAFFPFFSRCRKFFADSGEEGSGWKNFALKVFAASLKILRLSIGQRWRKDGMQNVKVILVRCLRSFSPFRPTLPAFLPHYDWGRKHRLRGFRNRQIPRSLNPAIARVPARY